MKNLLYLTSLLLAFNAASVFAATPPRVQVDGTWYTNGQTAYIECSKTVIAIIIDLQVNPAHETLRMRLASSANFTITDTQTDLQKNLNLDAGKQNGYIDVGYINNSGEIRVYIQQRPSAPSFTATNLCAGSSASVTATSSYNFQSTKPMHFLWQATGGVTVNGSNSYTSLPAVSSTVTIANSSSGSYSVKAVVASCSNIESATVGRNLGVPVITNPSYWLFDPGSNMWQFSQVADGSPVSYSFYVSSGSAILNQQSQDCYITTSTGATVCVTGTNPCGTGTPYCFYVPGPGGLLKTIYPNPASNVVSLEFNDSKSDNTIPFQVNLYSEKSTKAIKSISSEQASVLRSFKSNKKIEMDVSGLPRGTYFIHIVPDEKSKLSVQKERIILE
ncbi:T9SS type A sorting domain-containing protein [Dyadobacter sp. MSC1_007]|jgi:hypothetical protein|uniref:T9SS type A sorting domain-containing protein n=1 Tax=Dyadobacter sp. MSC1_007 TaxID=2909264 RepID=UPI002030BEB2|nr:T9SS type A sorting domain-containing protein [Dyadobacter sp. MSC1_007]